MLHSIFLFFLFSTLFVSSTITSAATRALVSLLIIYFILIFFDCFSASPICLCRYTLSHFISYLNLPVIYLICLWKLFSLLFLAVSPSPPPEYSIITCFLCVPQLVLFVALGSCMKLSLFMGFLLWLFCLWLVKERLTGLLTCWLAI